MHVVVMLLYYFMMQCGITMLLAVACWLAECFSAVLCVCVVCVCVNLIFVLSEHCVCFVLNRREQQSGPPGKTQVHMSCSSQGNEQNTKTKNINLYCHVMP
jgi:hypothetical protein